MPTPPTLVSYTETAWNTTGATKSTAVVSWLANDILVVIEGNEGTASDSVDLPTATGLTFVSQKNNIAASTCKTRVSTAVAGTAGSSAISATNADGTGSQWGFGVWVWRNSAGVGNSAEQHTTTKTVSLTPTGADGGIMWGTFDFSAGAAGTNTPTPTDIRQAAQSAGHYTFYAADLTDQTSAGAISYGVTGDGGTGPYSIVVLEIKAVASAGTPTVLPDDGEQFRTMGSGSSYMLLDDFTALVPLAPQMGWDDWDWNKSFEIRVSQQDDEPWHAFFTVPKIFDEDFARFFGTVVSPQEDEFLYAPGNYAPPFDPRNMDWTQYEVPSFDWSLGYGRLEAASEDYDSHFLQQINPSPSSVTGRSTRFGFMYPSFR